MNEFSSNPFSKTKHDGTGKVMKAVNNNSAEELLQALKEKADIEFSRTDATPLMVAIQNKRTELTLILIDKGADVSVKNRMGFSVLQSAIKNQENEVVQTLLRKRVSIDIKDDEGYSPLLTAIQYKNFEALRWLLQENCNTDITINDKTPLEYFKEVVDYENNADNPAFYEVNKLLKSHQSNKTNKIATPPSESGSSNQNTQNVLGQGEDGQTKHSPGVTQGRLSTITKKKM